LGTSSRAKEVASVLDELERGGMNGHDISDDEMAKSHARYLIGGASDVPNERIFRFGAICSPLRCRNCRLIGFILYYVCARARTRTHHAKIEFPERPDALRKFLSSLRNMGWNISLFHYRNHGAGAQRSPYPAIRILITAFQSPDIGKVLAGIQAPDEDSTQFSEFLRELGYSYVEETQNVIYKRYLRK